MFCQRQRSVTQERKVKPHWSKTSVLTGHTESCPQSLSKACATVVRLEQCIVLLQLCMHVRIRNAHE